MKRRFFMPQKNIWVINVTSLPFIIIFSLCLILLNALVWYNSRPAASDRVVPTFPAEDDPLLHEGKADIVPWSGWWWPFYDKTPPNLYQVDEAMDKYDQVSIARGKPNPEAMAWERKNHYTDKKEEGWFGHCNGWAAASVLEPEPRNAKDVSNVNFKVNDIMGLLSEWHWWDSALAFYGSRYDGEEDQDQINDIFPYELHYIIINYIGEQRLPIIMDTSGGTKEKDEPQVWNFPAYKYELAYRTDDGNNEQLHVHCRIWFSDTAHPKALKSKTFAEDYYYWIKGDKRRPTSGEWETAKEGGWGGRGDSRENHPDFLWYPATAKRHPVLEKEQYLEIVGQGENI